MCDRQKDIYIETDRQRQRERERETETERDKERDKEKERKGDRKKRDVQFFYQMVNTNSHLSWCLDHENILQINKSFPSIISGSLPLKMGPSRRLAKIDAWALFHTTV